MKKKGSGYYQKVRSCNCVALLRRYIASPISNLAISEQGNGLN